MSPHLHQHVAHARIDDFSRAASRDRLAAQARFARQPRLNIGALFAKRISAVDTIRIVPIARRFAR